MFVFSVKTTRKRLVSVMACVLLLVVLGCLSAYYTPEKASASVAQNHSAGRGATSEQRAAYLRALGYQVPDTYTQVTEIQIPETPDAAFTAYNAMQKKAGMDLSPYGGKRVKCWTYPVSNYPDNNDVEAHLYVYQNRIIGGDIAAVQAGGFMHGLTVLS